MSLGSVILVYSGAAVLDLYKKLVLTHCSRVGREILEYSGKERFCAIQGIVYAARLIA